MKKIYGGIIIIFAFCFLFGEIIKHNSEKTTFQVSSAWNSQIDVRSDVAIIYGMGDNKDCTFEQRVESWRQQGYITHFMTGIAWGGRYEDYFTKKWDLIDHSEEGQKRADGKRIMHSGNVPYIVPTEAFLNYIKEKHLKRVIDAGIDAIYFEEPEFFMSAGYSESFKKEWKNYYGFDWKPQHESPENTYLSNKLKYYLYYRAIDSVTSFAKEYGLSKGLNVRCYIPTHSLINYSMWRIVSPEASLASLKTVDGYIAQVWTGTARSPMYYNGKLKERSFENAYLEYGCMFSMTAPTGRKIFFLTDPIEDSVKDWQDCKKNYEATFAAQLLHPKISNYEVMPWPNRIYQNKHKNAETNQAEYIKRFYSTQMQVMINSLNSMEESSNRVIGSQNISVMMCNSIMFQGFPTHKNYNDKNLSGFFGQVMPLLKRGIPVNIMHMENVLYPKNWEDTKLLILTYYNMKPPSADTHKYIADWVKNGGVLLYCGKDDDPFQNVQEWWNTKGNNYKAASEHLFESMQMDRNAKEGEYKFGKGTVYVLRKNPISFALNKDEHEDFLDIVNYLYENKANAGKLEFKNSLRLERGNYIIIGTLDESVSDMPFVEKGLFIDLFDHKLPILKEKKVPCNTQAFLYNLNKVKDEKTPQILAAAARAYNEKREDNKYSFMLRSPDNTTNAMRVLLPKKPELISVKDSQNNEMQLSYEWNELSRTCFITHENKSASVNIVIKW